MASYGSLRDPTEGDEPSARQQRIGNSLLRRRQMQDGMFLDGSGCYVAPRRQPPTSQSSTSWFQIVRGNCGHDTVDTILALGNPMLLSPITFARYDPTCTHADGTPILDGEGNPVPPTVAPNAPTICLLDSTYQLGAWLGDFVEAQPTGLTAKMNTTTGLPDVSGDEYAVWEIVDRQSQQTTYIGKMGTTEHPNDYIGFGDGTVLTSGWATIKINGVSHFVQVWSDLLAPDGTIYAGDTIAASYKADERKWVAIASPCYDAGSYV